jgi:hypothetical protein
VNLGDTLTIVFTVVLAVLVQLWPDSAAPSSNDAQSESSAYVQQPSLGPALWGADWHVKHLKHLLLSPWDAMPPDEVRSPLRPQPVPLALGSTSSLT